LLYDIASDRGTGARRVHIVVDDLLGPEIVNFLQDHIDEMQRITPPESKHALDIDDLRKPDITFWSVWDGAQLLGCGALKELDDHHGEVKSMRTEPRRKRAGVASALLDHMIQTARQRGYHRISLETGSTDFFMPAQALYRKHGFSYCEPFAGYEEDPNSVYMKIDL